MGNYCCDAYRTPYNLDHAPEITTDSEESERGRVRSEGVCYRSSYELQQNHSLRKVPQLNDVQSMPMPITRAQNSHTLHLRTVSSQEFVSHVSRNCEPSPRGIRRAITMNSQHHCRSKTLQPSLKQRMKDRQNEPPIMRIQGEDGAKLYMDALENNTLNDLNRTFQLAEVMVHKGQDVMVELRRQDDVLRTTNNDIQAAEVDINETSFKLKGMKSLRGKLGNMVRRKKNNSHTIFNSARGFDFKDDNERTSEQFQRSKTMPATKSFRSSSLCETKQDHIKMGVKQLCSTLDIIRIEQMDIGDELARQEGHLNQTQANMDRLDGKVQNQTKLMSGIR